ncbi:FHA domain-containing protein [Spirulina sp. 06S082]|uniref:FHA domain-containing protein n=1 Tax=Spirulina sp. 06S082 TaxID=3110248 RepID=UPI002B2207F1|nr:FHA domain-containing protein [Spirulina sp. 06S082]MEA5472359.1 FHA domain-containing protein [Spirulina sp. 06S082]
MIELEQKLGLYQVFLNLYENNQGLLNEILQLENSHDRSLKRLRGKYTYIIGVVEDQRVYLLANLMGNGSQKLFQPQNIWTIGRGQKAGISIPDDRLSRNHAAIQYVPDRGFYLHDLNSTNGTYVNQEPVSDRILLQDGDRVRLGSLVFYFSCCQETRQLVNTPQEIINTLNKLEKSAFSQEQKELPETSEHKTCFFLTDEDRKPAFRDRPAPELNPVQQSEILDRFFHQQRNSL